MAIEVEIGPQLREALVQVQHQYETNIEFTQGLALMGGPGQGIGVDEPEPEVEIETVRNFGDIARSSPRNERENDLLTRAQAFLSPGEFKNCVDTNAEPQEVEQMVTGFEMYNEVHMFMQRQEELEKEQSQQQQEEKEKEVDKDPMSLGDAYGVMHEVSKALSETNIVDNDKDKDVSAPDTPSQDKDNDKGLGR